MHQKWCRGVVVITTAHLHSTKPELRLCAGWNPACGISEICNGEDLWQWTRLEIRLNLFCWSTIPQNNSSSSSSSSPKIMIICYTVPEKWLVMVKIVIFHLGCFLPYCTPNSPKKSKFKKKINKKAPGDIIIYTCIPKLLITWCTFPEVRCATDRPTGRRTDGQMDGQTADRWTGRQMNGWTDGWQTDERMDGQTDGWTNR